MNLIEQIKVNDTSIDGFQGTYYSETPEYVQVTTDSEGKVLEGIKIDGSKHIGGDLIVDGSIYNKSLNIEQIVEDILEQVDEVLEPVEETLSYFDSTENPEWLQVTTDSDGKILEGITTEGKKQINLLIDTPTSTIGYIDSPEWLQITLDKENRILEGINKNGEKYIANINYPLMNSIDEKINFFSIPYINKIDFIVEEFCSLFKNSTAEFESFIFFTDPHLGRPHYQDMNYEKFYNHMALLKKYYTLTPTDFVLCGGDLIEEDTQEVAMFKLGFIDGYMRNNFNNYYPIFGNHDDNYQGKLDDTAPSKTGQLSNICIKNLMFRNFKNKYYTFKQGVTRFYILDTGCDWNPNMTGDWVEGDYRWEQLDWLGRNLLENEDEHIALGLHIYKSGESIPQLTNYAIQMLIAFNHKESITLNGITYNFSSKNGTCHFIIAGHKHVDLIYYDYEIPAILTTTMYDSCEFDLCFVDYNTKQFHAIRANNGRHRIMNIV